MGKIKGVIRSRKSKERQKKEKNTTHVNNDLATIILHKQTKIKAK
jgi:hypothetical protein